MKLAKVFPIILLVLFILTLSLVHPPTASRLAGAPGKTIAQLKRGFPALARQGQTAPAGVAAAGDLDLTFAGFGTSGIVVTPQTSATEGLAVQPDGKIVVAGHHQSGLLVMRYLSNGALDTTFGNSGKAIIPRPEVGFSVRGVALQPADGKIVVVGYTAGRGDFAVTRLTATGALDTAFGNQGFVTTNFEFGSSTDDEFATDRAYAVLVQPDGKIVVAGEARIDGDYDFAVARYFPDGSLDPSFGGDGRVTIGFGGDDTAYDIAQQADGKLVLVGEYFGGTFTLTSDFAVARLNSNGTLDGSFSSDGKLTTDMGDDLEDARAVALQPDGKIVVAGDGFDIGVLVARYHADGSLDNTFDGDGKLGIGSWPESTHDVAVQPDGKIVLLGRYVSPDDISKFVFYRLNVNGSFDTTFNAGGSAFFHIGQGGAGLALALLPDGRILGLGSSDQQTTLIRLWPDGLKDLGGKQTLGFEDPLLLGSREQASALAIQPDGKTIVAGSVTNTAGTETDIALARFLPDGRPDTSFGIQGRVKFDAFNQDFARAITLQSDGKIVVAGWMRNGSVVNFMIARFLSTGQPDTTFGFGGFNVQDFFNGDDYGNAIALTPDGKFVVAGSAWNGTRYVFAVTRFNSNGSLDTSFGNSSKQVYDFGQANWASAVVVQRDRKIVVGGSTGSDFALVRFQENGLLDLSFGSGGQGRTITDMGGTDFITALAITPSGEFYAAGGRNLNGNDDFALAHYASNGGLLTCLNPDCTHTWPTGKAFVDWGGSETATSIDLRSDDQIVAAGCVGGLLGWAQFSPTSTTPLKGKTYLAGAFDECACGVQFIAPNKLMVAATQNFNGDADLALARFETTAIIPTFEDVPTSHAFWPFIEAVYDFAITLGCQANPRRYCPTANVTREQMAAFLIRALHLPGYVPPQPGTQRFADVPPSNPFYAFIDEMALRQITSGCGGGNYCPTAVVTREQMAAFIIRALHDPGYVPPTPAFQRFADVPPSNPFYAHIEEMAVRGITLGCGGNNYCPTAPVTREQMAVFLARAFNLPLP
jgi:uncharacterized delta-60 repeat protein